MESFYRNEYRNSLEDLFIENKYEGLDDERTLELLLLYTLTIQQAAPVAKRLLEHFKTLSNVIKADFDELIEIGGMDRDSAVLVSLGGTLPKREEINEARKINVLNSSKKSIDYFRALFATEADKTTCACCCDDECKLLCRIDVKFNDAGAADCLKAVEEKGAKNFIIGVKVKGDDLTPSKSDLEFVRELSKELIKRGCFFCDVVLVNDSKGLAFAEDLRYILYLGC